MQSQAFGVWRRNPPKIRAVYQEAAGDRPNEPNLKMQQEPLIRRPTVAFCILESIQDANDTGQFHIVKGAAPCSVGIAVSHTSKTGALHHEKLHQKRR